MRHPEKVFSSVCSEPASCWLHWMPLFLSLENQSNGTIKRCYSPLSHLPSVFSFLNTRMQTGCVSPLMLIFLGKLSGQEELHTFVQG